MTFRSGTLAVLGFLACVPQDAEAGKHHHASRAGGRMHAQAGIASYYASRFHGRTMADGGVFRVGSNSAASLTLPLGTVARVTNRENHRTAIVIIRDRGPYAARRIIDLSPATAGRLGFKHDGLAAVTVYPLRLAAGYVR